MGGLLDILIKFFLFFVQPYNFSLFQYKQFKKLYKTASPFRKFSPFLLEHNCSCFFKSSRSSRRIQKCEEIFEGELTFDHILLKMRQLQALINDDEFLKLELRNKLIKLPR